MNSQISNNTNFLLLMRFTFTITDSHIEYNQYNFTNAYFQAVYIQGRTDKKNYPIMLNYSQKLNPYAMFPDE